MRRILDDGRELMAAYTDIQEFFSRNHIVGRTIKDIRPAAFDYMIRNLDEIDNVFSLKAQAAIETDDRVCIVFDDGDNLEIEFSGDGPIIIGFNTADFNTYPIYDGTCYSLHTLFKHCIGHAICQIQFAPSEHRMLFPAYCGIDMSEDDEGVYEISFLLDNKTVLKASGSVDWFVFEHTVGKEKHSEVPYKDLLRELNEDTLYQIFGPDYNTLFQKHNASISDISFLFRQDFLKYIEKNKNKIIGKRIEGFYNSVGVYDTISDSPIVLVFDSFCIVIHYFYYSDIELDIVDRSLFESDHSLNFLFKDIEGSRKVYLPEHLDEEFPLYGIPIQDLALGEFSSEFEINPVNGDTRPEGGDYFDVIRITMENGQVLCICGCDSMMDGYIEAWIES